MTNEQIGLLVVIAITLLISALMIRIELFFYQIEKKMSDQILAWIQIGLLVGMVVVFLIMIIQGIKWNTTKL